MNKLRFMSVRGHEELLWESAAFEAGDPEALDIVAEAEHIVAEAIAAGHGVFQVEAPDQPAWRVERLDPTARQTIVVPRVVGG